MLTYPLQEASAYAVWREEKLNNYPRKVDELIIELNNPIKLMDYEVDALISTCARANMVFYKTRKDGAPKQIVHELARQLGLQELDANLCAEEDRLSAIENSAEKNSHYIPYTDKALNWHTDGYYNSEPERIQAFIMHCVRPAKLGGENTYLDPEIAYILLRDENPAYITALMDPLVMTIPANEEFGEKVRGAQTGPVFFIDQFDNICMRYTARQRNIIWKQDKVVQAALSFLQEILQDNSYLFSYRLNAGEGVVCNNVLHKRTAFEDDKNNKRLLYRGRYYNRIRQTETLRNAVNQ